MQEQWRKWKDEKMKMKRYFAPEARQAIRELREEQGPDAVIISNKKVAGGVEIIAALDYEDALVNNSLGNPFLSKGPVIQPSRQVKKKQSQKNQNTLLGSTLGTMRNELKGLREIMEAPLMQFVWGEMGRVQPLHANMVKRLMMLGLDSRLCELLTQKIEAKGLQQQDLQKQGLKNQGSQNQVWIESLQLLAKLIPIENDDLMKRGGVISLVGPTGVGKTTTIAKLAARFALRHGRNSISLISTDSYRIGAQEQLLTYGKILGVPVQTASNSKELKVVLKNAGKYKLTLIDTAGMSQRDMGLSECLSTLNVGSKRIKNYLVLSATGQMNVHNDVIRSFGKVGLQGCMLTKIDEAVSLGEVLSVLIKHKLPLAYVCDGQKVPDHIHPARGNLLVKEAVKLMQNKTEPSEEELAYKFGGMVTSASI